MTTKSNTVLTDAKVISAAVMSADRVAIRLGVVTTHIAEDEAKASAVISKRDYCTAMIKALGYNWDETPEGKLELAALAAIAIENNYGGTHKVTGKPGAGAYVLTRRIRDLTATMYDDSLKITLNKAYGTLQNAETVADKAAAKIAVKQAQTALKAGQTPKPRGKKEAKPAAPVNALTPEATTLLAASTITKLLVIGKDEASAAFSEKARVTLSKLGDAIAAYLAQTA